MCSSWYITVLLEQLEDVICQLPFSDCLKCKGYYCTHPLTCPTSTICTGSSLTNVEATVPMLIIVIKRFSKQYVKLFLVGVVPLSYEKRGRFSCNWTGDQQMVSECVQHIDVHVKTHETETRSSSPFALLAHHTQSVLSYSGTSWITFRVSADWYLLFWVSLHIQWDETQLHH